MHVTKRKYHAEFHFVDTNKKPVRTILPEAKDLQALSHLPSCLLLDS